MLKLRELSWVFESVRTARPSGHLAQLVLAINCSWGGPGFESHEGQNSDLELERIEWSCAKSGTDRKLNPDDRPLGVVHSAVPRPSLGTYDEQFIVRTN